MLWDGTPYLLVLMISAAITATLTIYMWERRSVSGAVPFAGFLLSTGFWALMEVIDRLAGGSGGTDLWLYLKLIGMVFAPVCWLVFSAQYTSRLTWLEPRRLVALYFIPTVTLVFQLCELAIVHLAPGRLAAILFAITINQAWFWVDAIYNLVLLLLGSIWLMQAIKQSNTISTNITFPIVLSLFLPWIAVVLQYYSSATNLGISFTPVAYSITGFFLAWGIFRFGLLDVAPIARSAVVENLMDGVLIYDQRERVMDANQAAANMLGVELSWLFGKPIRSVLSEFPQLGDHYETNEPISIETTIGTADEEQTIYDIRLAPISVSQSKNIRRLIVLRDVTRYRFSEQELEKSHELLLATLEATADGILVMSAKGKPVHYNQRFLEIWRIPEEISASGDEKSLITCLLEQLVNPAAFYRLMNKLSTQPDADSYDVLELKDNRVFERYSRPQRIGDLRVGRVWSFRDITEQRRSADKLRYLSTHDILTGLYNRVYFEEEINRLENSRQFPISMIMVDVDDLKRTNDRLGHQAGDELLRKSAEVLRQACRAEDMVARIGGDEFGILLPYSNEQVAENAVERINNMASMTHVGEAEMILSLSIGFSTAHNGELLRKVLRQADKAMYLEKEAKHKRRSAGTEVENIISPIPAPPRNEAE